MQDLVDVHTKGAKVNNTTRYKSRRRNGKQQQHAQVSLETREKVRGVENKLTHVTRKKYGTNPEYPKQIVDRVAKLAVLYGCEVWGNKTASVANRKVLAAAQRPFILAMTVVRAYRTTPTVAWWIEGGVYFEEHARNLEHIMISKFDIARALGMARLISILRAPSLEQDQTLEVYTDACVRESTGLGIVEVANDEATTHRYMLNEKLDAVWVGLRIGRTKHGSQKTYW